MAVGGAHIWSFVGGQLSSYSNTTKLGSSRSSPNKCLCDSKAALLAQKSCCFLRFSCHDWIMTLTDPPLHAKLSTNLIWHLALISHISGPAQKQARQTDTSRIWGFKSNVRHEACALEIYVSHPEYPVTQLKRWLLYLMVPGHLTVVGKQHMAVCKALVSCWMQISHQNYRLHNWCPSGCVDSKFVLLLWATQSW